MWVDTRAEEHHHPEKGWVDQRAKAHYDFRLQLETTALRDLLDDPDRLAALRHDVEQLDRYKKTFKHALAETKTDLDHAVLKASEPHWDCGISDATGQIRAQLDPDSEDDEKHEPAEVRAKRLAWLDSSEKKCTESCNRDIQEKNSFP